MKKIIFLFLMLFSVSGFAESRFKLGETIPLMTGNGEYTAIEMNLVNSNHTGSNNKIYGIRIPDMTLDAQALGTAIDIGQGWHYGLHLTTNLGVLFGPVSGGTQVYYDGSSLSISDKLTIYGDLFMSNKGIKDFDILQIKMEDIGSGACTQDQIRIDVGGATKELCYCDNSDWLCTPLRQGPID